MTASLNAILWVQQTGEKWHPLPGSFPPQQTCYLHYTSWKKSGVLAQLIALLETIDHKASQPPSKR
ncbi:transposase [Paraburkholderia sp.]|uniref:transposase n=1 Tax=Paraburkholderia sp. TaxID=1926495 RepID=UPI003A521A83